MAVEIIFVSETPHNNIIKKILTEDALYNNYERANASIRAFGTHIDMIIKEEGKTKIFIKNIDNLLLG